MEGAKEAHKSQTEHERINICFKGLGGKDTVNIDGIAYGNGSIVELPIKHANAYIKAGLAFAANTDEGLEEARATQALLIKNDKTRKEILEKAASESSKELNKLNGDLGKGGAK